MSCGNSPARTGRVNCADCAAKNAECKQRRKQLGLCVSCGNPNDRGPKKHCSACAAKTNTLAKAMRMKNPNRERRRHRTRKSRLRKAGICIGCGKSPSAAGTICKNCRERLNRAYLAKKLSATQKLRTKEDVNEKESDYRNEHSAGD